MAQRIRIVRGGLPTNRHVWREVPVSLNYVYIEGDGFLDRFVCANCGFLNVYEGDGCSCRRQAVRHYYDEPVGEDDKELVLVNLAAIAMQRRGLMTIPTRAYVKVYRISNNGERIVETNAVNERDFIDAAVPAILNALAATRGDQEYTLMYVLPAIIDIACKLRGYKAESVQEQRVLLSGSVWPDGADLIATNSSEAEHPEIDGPDGSNSELERINALA